MFDHASNTSTTATKRALRKSIRLARENSQPRHVLMADIFEWHPDLDDALAWRWALLHEVAEERLEDGRPCVVPLILTERPDVMARYAAEHGWPSNAWAGTTVEDQRRANERIPHLLQVPAPVRFLSCEPLLGPVYLREWLDPEHCVDGCEQRLDPEDPLGSRPYCPGHLDIHWIIVGGESGHGARPMHPEWARSLRDQCQEAGVPFLFKQNGAWVEAEQGPGDPVVAYLDGHADEPFGWGMLDRQRPHTWMYRVGKKAAGRLLDGRTWDEIPTVTGDCHDHH